MKKFLEANKIYFEVFSMAFLGLMAVIVSFTQWRTSSREFELHKYENMPLIKVSYELIKTDTSGTYDTEILRVTNEGKIVKRFNKAFFSFYHFNIKPLDSNGKGKDIYVPVADFFGLTFNSNNLSGKLFESFSYHNNSNIVNAERHCQAFFSTKRLFITVTREVYFKFDFTDISNEKHTIYMDTFGNEITAREYQHTKARVNSYEPGLVAMRDVNNEFIDNLVNSAQ
ncbi:MAG TPA: hypothetical protein VFS25_18660 [Chitinophaga sp.]|uniref:hypothetical protein n=1 Tax=Chitinophaga sp. TaxID=1869181 RepID=UPI002DB8357B|nr:hypothetical protein [Chitinophaga sp.]HEU4554878.1 hypothetical protein [Chitinophaga sp.]